MVCLSDWNLSQTMDVFKLAIMTLVRYVDRPSRSAVLHLAKMMVRRDELRGRPEGEPNVTKMGNLNTYICSLTRSFNVFAGVTEQVIGWLHAEANRLSKMIG